jgi:hypothetical protein
VPVYYGPEEQCRSTTDRKVNDVSSREHSAASSRSPSPNDGEHWPPIVGSAPAELPPLSTYFSHQELLAAHPAPPWAIYHNAEHSALVRLMAFELAKGFGLPEQDQRFLSEVALLHDWDPARPLGTPARVPATLKALGLDFTGKRPLTSPPDRSERGPSILRERFGWGKLELQMAMSLIFRTEFPFDGPHPNPFYSRVSPSQRYTRSLQALPPRRRVFVLEQGPILSQFADQTAWYATQTFDVALRAVEGLVNELNAAQGPRRSTQDLNTTGFLYSISQERSFEVDYRLGRAFGIEGFVLPTQDDAFSLLPPTYARCFEANKNGFDAYDRALASGHGEGEAAAEGRRVYHETMSTL